MAFEAEFFAAAQLVAVPPLESVRYVAAQVQELALQLIHGQWLGFHDPLQRDALPLAATAEQADPLCLTLIQIPAGSYLMGSPEDEPERHLDEGPQHEVTVQELFMTQSPITQAQWREVAGWQEREAERWGRELNPNPSDFGDQADSDQRPVEQVSWHDAMEFCNRLSQRTGRYYTLPSEAQWEYACRAGSTTPFAFGATLSAELANYDATITYGDGPKGEYRQQTTPVGMFPANAWGLHDMHGTVWEWCLDHWHDSYEGAPSDGSAWLTPSASEEERRLLRGGSWSSLPRNCRSAYRNRYLPDFAFNYVGFRVVCLPQGPSLNA
jgi:formylglycine-generating enzyme required for sulfatase activity